VKGDQETSVTPLAPASGTKSIPASTVPLPSTKTETVGLPSAFPSGSLSFGDTEKPFRLIARAHGGGYDIDNIADAYRHQVGSALLSLSGARLMNSFEAFCRSYAARRGPLG
jgi:hypothetical protein